MSLTTNMYWAESTGQSSQTLKEFSAFMRYFSSRMIQSVVQARMGKLASHTCSPDPEHADWFNIAVDEIGEIAAYLKNSVNRSYLTYSLTLDFILYTADGDTLPLESWTIRLDKDTLDPTVNVHTTLYHQLSTLLKSIMAVSRVTPTYRHYVKNQSPDTYVIFYRVFDSLPDLSLLGDEQKFRRIGSLPSPFGTIYVDLYYRTKMEISSPPFDEKKVELETGKIVPSQSSERIAVSPMSTSITDFNLNNFSASPLSQDISLDLEQKPSFKLGRSVSSEGQESDRVRNPSECSNKSGRTSPYAPTPNSFPQRSVRPFQPRSRNNSFPFSTLLLESQCSLSQSRLLPKVPEDAIIATGSLHPSSSDRAIEMRRPDNLRLQKRNSLACDFFSNPVDGKVELQKDSHSQSDQPSSGPMSIRKGIVFTTGEKSQPHTPLKPTENDEEEEANLSDDSFVKVVPFASTEDLGADLSEFFKEVRLAPKNLPSFAGEGTDILSRQLDEFREKETQFDDFVSGLKDSDEVQ